MKPAKPISKEAVRAQVEFFKRAAVKPAPDKPKKEEHDGVTKRVR